MFTGIVHRAAGWLGLLSAIAFFIEPATAHGASPEMTKWVEQVAAQFEASYQKEVKGPFDAGIAALRQNYIASLVRGMDAANDARKLDEVQLFRTERERFLGGGHKPPSDDSDNPVEAIKTLRLGFRAGLAQLDQDRFARARLLHTRCDQTLAQTQQTLTQRQRPDDAALVKAKRDELAKAWLTPPAVASKDPGSARPGKSAELPKTELSKATAREAVEWVLSVGGSVTLPEGKEGRGEKPLTSAAALPGGAVTFAKVALETAKLTGSVADADLPPLAGLRSVKFLNFQGVKVTDAGLGFLDGWSDLEKFHINGSRVSDATVPRFARFPTLQGFQLRYAENVTGKTFDKLAGLKSLRWIDLEKSGITDAGVTAIVQLKGLEELLLSRTEITDAAVAQVATLRGLRKLHLQDTKVTAAGLAPLSGLPKLEQLGFLSTSLADYPGAVKQVAAVLPRISGLHIAGSEVRGTHLEPLSTFRGLKELSFQGSDLGEGAVAALGKLTGLETLSIGYTSFGDADLGGLTQLKKLQTLKLNNSKVTDAGLQKLKGMRNLKELEVRTTSVTPGGVAMLEKELPGCKVRR